ncbi:Glutamyl-tRNA synthetase [Liberibacter crescens BT-1]|uniref:Glutamate--tRNA ligase n=1 Tax=Liberibacter crescens (strain BT-1) TaxID=1215343 RepID=L0EVE9_LIBCB|nr:glutamate--tRNA ligase [Liberibacter crescens]AGA64633.1 Glutamyl-tRNA synthetase [Liberibacter crescens BT-1]AMC12747.1 glutamyl-tRNA synthetase [Liberibacter crescens]
MVSSDVRVRVAPSPTGEPHVGTVYTALFNYLFAKKMGGEFILRIEDTDSERSTKEFEDNLINALKWCGLSWIEGPDVGGPYGPYRQSDRKHIYNPYVQTLINKGHAFRCFCSVERLKEMRKEQLQKGISSRYDGYCLRLSEEESNRYKNSGKPYTVRMKIPERGSCTFKDRIYGNIEIPWSAIDMQVLLKENGMPTYHMANVVDDYLMKITHVARGEEWLPSVPKHILIYEYLNWKKPEFIHLPLMRNIDKSKLSKRKNPTSISYYSALGYLPEALINFLGLLFIQNGTDDELMDIEGLSKKFTLDNFSKSGAIFDLQKLDWLNGRWIREKLSQEEFINRVFRWSMEKNSLIEGLKLSQSRITHFGALPDIASFLFKSNICLTPLSFSDLSLSSQEIFEILDKVQEDLEKLKEWKKKTIEEQLRITSKELNKKFKIVLAPLFIAISGSKRSLPLFDSIEILGRSVVRQRLKVAKELVISISTDL